MKTDQKPHSHSSSNIFPHTNKSQSIYSQHQPHSQQIVIKNIDSGTYQLLNLDQQQQHQDEINKHNQKHSLIQNKNNQTRLSLWNHYWDQMAKNDLNLLKTVLNQNPLQLQQILNQQPLELNSFKYIDGWTLLHHAILSSSSQIVQILLQHKINPNSISNQMKRTPLHQAVLANKLQSIKLLIQYQANPNLQDIDGNTPAHFAADLSYFHTFQTLMTSQIKLNLKLKNHQQMTIIDCIRDKNIFDMLQQQEHYFKDIHPNQNLSHQDQQKQNYRRLKPLYGLLISRPSKNDLIEKFLNRPKSQKNLLKYQKYQIKSQKHTHKTSLLKPPPANQSVKQSISSSDSTSVSRKKSKLGTKPSEWIQKKGNLIASQSIYLMKQSIMEAQDSNIPSESLVNYQFLRFVGAGGFADVFLARRKKSSKLFAIKKISKQKILQNNLKRYVYSERNIMIKLQHPFIVEALGMFQDESHLYISMEYCECGDLLRLLSMRGSLPQNQVKLYAAQVGLALEHMHQKNILFRDLKSANVLIGKDGYVKVSDFGLAKESMVSFSFLGSVQYLAPEMLVDSQMKEHTRSIDWYLFGVLIFELLTGKPPFYGESQQVVFKRIRQEKPVFPQHLSKQCRSLLSGLLQKQPSKRLGSLGDFPEIKSHQWFQDVKFQKLYNKQYPMGQIEPTIKESDVRKKMPIDNFQEGKRFQYFKEWNYIKKNH